MIIPVQVPFSNNCAQKARQYKGATIALATSSADPLMFAKRVWSACAVPSVLYASEALLIKAEDLKVCEQMQSRLAKRLLSVEISSANMAAQRMVGLVPIRAKYYNRALRFFHKMRSAKEGLLSSIGRIGPVWSSDPGRTTTEKL